MSIDRFSIFKQLHHADTPLLLANVWDPASAVLVQSTGAPALATSSAAVAWALGYADGSHLPRAETMAAIGRIARVIKVPLTVDMEDGYSDDPETVAGIVAEAVDCGASGINIEDSGKAPEGLARKIEAIKRTPQGRQVFVNARTDVYLRGLAEGDEAAAMSLERLRLYAEAGADGAFVPGLAAPGQTASVAQGTALPLNLMLMPGMAPIAELHAAGVRRFSAGPSLFRAAYGHALGLAQSLHANRSTAGLFDSGEVTYASMNAA
ncbi:MAG TPA: isocitrate lyase/phosphoenolpyruvate mutase family protein, partial [Burkholderiaceae bacterium]